MLEAPKNEDKIKKRHLKKSTCSSSRLPEFKPVQYTPPLASWKVLRVEHNRVPCRLGESQDPLTAVARVGELISSFNVCFTTYIHE